LYICLARTLVGFVPALILTNPFCRVDIAHGVENVGGGHFSLFGGYLEKSDEILVVDTNPSMSKDASLSIARD
jgi:hypothetical protein